MRVSEEGSMLLKPIQHSVIHFYARVHILTENLNARLNCKLEFKNAITQQFKTPPVHLCMHERTQPLPVPVRMNVTPAVFTEGTTNSCACFHEHV